MTTQAQAQTAIDLATKWIGKGIGTMVSSAQLCLDDAKERLARGVESKQPTHVYFEAVVNHAKRSLAYSVGILHPDYQSVARMDAVITQQHRI